VPRERHGTVGIGTFGRLGCYKDIPSVWIDFD